MQLELLAGLKSVPGKSWFFSAVLIIIGVCYLKDGLKAVIERKIPANRSATRWFFRDTQPFKFWAECVTYFLGGIGLLLFSFYLIRAEIFAG